ncbi:zinc finger protein 2 homolog [Teleopsis dalmanni]|uniref:zinc finger protein 2 homolog n=1 Tax=Teleopsis dalmanni TaxID=139649 RepID=UPI0018CDFFEB|nr:zinc finger protein 2 homolog [Teleopsis dalmanni]
MNDSEMGFKHNILHRLPNFEVCPAKMKTKSNEIPSLPTSPRVTDFSINRILSASSQNEKVSTSSSKKHQPLAKFQSDSNLNTFNVNSNTRTREYTEGVSLQAAFERSSALDLSKSSSDLPTQSFPSIQYHQNMQCYDSFVYPNFLVATKFYTQFLPHLLPNYSSQISRSYNLPTSFGAYQKRYFEPYILNSNELTTTHSLPHSPTIGTNAALHQRICLKARCSGCAKCYSFLDGSNINSTASTMASPTMHSSSTTSFNTLNNCNKKKLPTDMLFKNSTISFTTVTNLNLLTASSKNFADRCNTASASVTSNLEELSFKCRICEKVFGCSETLEAHEKTHKSPRYECTDCGKGFSQLRNYKYHLSVHRGTKEFAAECSECGKTFNDKGYLSSHMKIHRNKKEYECMYCPKSFNQRVAFNMHVRIHTGVKPHKCSDCGKRFSRKMLLKQHMRTHSGEKPYKCSVCGKSFADRSNMTLHHRLHSGIKPFNCPICPKAFTKKHHLKTHLNYHTGCKPYVCPHPNCKQAFTQSSNMRTHAKKCQFRPLQLQYPVSANASATPSMTGDAARSAIKSNIAIPSTQAVANVDLHIGIPSTVVHRIPLLSAASSSSLISTIMNNTIHSSLLPPSQQTLESNKF